MIEVNRHRLANGLRIVHSQAKGARMVAVDVLYGVGSRDEGIGVISKNDSKILKS